MCAAKQGKQSHLLFSFPLEWDPCCLSTFGVEPSWFQYGGILAAGSLVIFGSNKKYKISWRLILWRYVLREGIWNILMENNVKIFEDHFSSSQLFSTELISYILVVQCWMLLKVLSWLIFSGIGVLYCLDFCSAHTLLTWGYICLLIYPLIQFLHNKILILS
jgi:hypothetical protein